MKQYRALRAKTERHRRKKRLFLNQLIENKHITGFSLYWGFMLSGEQYNRILQASVQACVDEIEAARKEDCEAFIAAGGGNVLLSSFVIMLEKYEAEQYPEYYGALQFLTKIVENRILCDFSRQYTTKKGHKAFICMEDRQALASDLAWNDGVWCGGFVKAAEWYTPPETAKQWADYMVTADQLRHAAIEGNQEKIDAIVKRAADLGIPLPLRPADEVQIDPATEEKEPAANVKTRFGQREENALFPGRKTKRERENEGIRSTALTHIAVIASKLDGVVIKEPRLRSFGEAFDEAAPSLFEDEEVLPANSEKKAEPIPKEVFDYYSMIQTDIIDDLKAGGDGTVYRDIYSFCKTLGIPVNTRSLPEIEKTLEQMLRISPDFGDEQIRGGSLYVKLDPKTGVLMFHGTAINEVVAKIKQHYTEVLKDPGKEFAPKNLKAELLRQRDTEAKNAIRQVIAPGFELRGLYKEEGDEYVDYEISYRKIISETDGFLDALNEARGKTRGYETRFLRRKLDSIQEYLRNYTEYPARYKDFTVYVVQSKKPGGSAILDSVLHLQHKGLAKHDDTKASGASGADVK